MQAIFFETARPLIEIGWSIKANHSQVKLVQIPDTHGQNFAQVSYSIC